MRSLEEHRKWSLCLGYYVHDLCIESHNTGRTNVTAPPPSVIISRLNLVGCSDLFLGCLKSERGVQSKLSGLRINQWNRGWDDHSFLLQLPLLPVVTDDPGEEVPHSVNWSTLTCLEEERGDQRGHRGRGKRRKREGTGETGIYRPSHRKRMFSRLPLFTHLWSSSSKPSLPRSLDSPQPRSSVD